MELAEENVQFDWDCLEMPEALPRARASRSPHTRTPCWYVAERGHRWAEASRIMGGAARGFSEDAVRGRVKRILGIEKAGSRRTGSSALRWTALEDTCLLAHLADVEGRVEWTTASIAVGTGRTPRASRNRARRLAASC
ncbi:MAG: hypothetical protein CMI16_12610 [Opitutaceae bacterium]|nr:hypothetical protein [Opitutaceae bacterium]